MILSCLFFLAHIVDKAAECSAAAQIAWGCGALQTPSGSLATPAPQPSGSIWRRLGGDIWSVPQPHAIWAGVEHAPASSSICVEKNKLLRTRIQSQVGQFAWLAPRTISGNIGPTPPSIRAAMEVARDAVLICYVN